MIFGLAALMVLIMLVIETKMDRWDKPWPRSLDEEEIDDEADDE